jgi:hypothetical protein
VATTFSTDPNADQPLLAEVAPRRTDVGLKELIAIGLAVVLADVTIYRGHGFTGVAAFLLGACALLFFGKRRRHFRISVLVVGGMLGLLATHLVWYGSPLQVATGVVLLIAFATSLDGQTPYLLAVLTMGSQAALGGLRAIGEYSNSVRGAGPRLNRTGSLNYILPAIAFFAFSVLFILANPDVVSFVSGQLEAFLTRISDWLVRAALRPTEPLFWLGVALVMAGLLRPILRFSALQPFFPADAQPASVAAPLYTAFRNTLLTVIALFAVYLVYEFYTMSTRDFPKTFYYAGYAHEGAAWLTVALALATLILSVVFSGRVLDDPRLPKLRTLAWIWSLENLLLSAAVYNRLFIYIDFNGMTRMRIIGLFGISLVVVGFLLVVWKIIQQRSFPWLIHRQMWALGIAVYLFSITPVDWIAASYNVRRILAGDISASMQIGVQQLDLEGVMALPPLLDSDSPVVREGVAALIADRYLQLQADHESRQIRGWTAFQASDQVALDRFEAVREQWKAYEDPAKRAAAIKRLHDFAYQWY